MTRPGPPRLEAVERRAARLLALLAAFAALACSDVTARDDTCTPDDADGVIGGEYVFELSVDDDSFSPLILKAQNDATLRLTLKNNGSVPHGFVVDCLPTPNDNGCPTEACFPDEAKLGPLAPGESVSTTFVTPLPEGIYDFRSDVPGDAQSGQLILQ